jgi:hypothetical protein
MAHLQRDHDRHSSPDGQFYDLLQLAVSNCNTPLRSSRAANIMADKEGVVAEGEGREVRLPAEDDGSSTKKKGGIQIPAAKKGFINLASFGIQVPASGECVHVVCDACLKLKREMLDAERPDVGAELHDAQVDL